jgi:hypothetical protein
MRAVVVYESMFGHTRVIAESIGSGLRSGIERVEVSRVSDTDPDGLAGADLVVVGGPTHVHALSSSRTRQAAVADPTKYGGGASAQPGAAGTGLREWFTGLPRQDGLAAAFDTRASAPPIVTGRASRGIAKRLRACGFTIGDRTQSFLVGPGAVLLPGEADRAEQWGCALASAVMSAVRDRPYQETE